MPSRDATFSVITPSTTSTTASNTGAITAGDALVACARGSGAIGSLTVKDNINGSVNWTQVDSDSTNSKASYLFQNSAAAANAAMTITISSASLGTIRFVGSAIAGVVTSGQPFGHNFLASGATQSSLSTGNVANDPGGNAVWAGYISGNTATGGSFTAGTTNGASMTLGSGSGGTNGAVADEFLGSSVGGTQNASMTYSSSFVSGDDGFIIVLNASIAAAPTSARVTNRFTGPQVLRFYYRQPSVLVTEFVFPNQIVYTPPILIANKNVGPQVLRYLYRQPSVLIFGTSGSVANVKTLTAVLSFTGPTNLTILTSKQISGGLTFTGPTNLKNAITKLISGGLSFTGPTNLKNAISKFMTGGLSFTGPTNLIKNITKLISGGLTFTGPVNLKNAVGKGLTASLSFSGTLARNLLKTLTGTLTFTGPTNLKNAITKLTSGSLTFTGALGRTVTKNLAAATLSFTGSFTKTVQKVLNAASLSFAGSLLSGRSLHQALSATLAFTGAMTKQISTGLNANLNFSGLLVTLKNLRFVQVVANLNSQGNLTSIHWYYGVFKQTSVGVLRAVYRALNAITRNRNLT